MIPLFKVRMSPEAKSKVAFTLDSGYIGQGPRVEEFEDMLQIHLQSDVRPVTVNSGTSALDLALELIDVGPGDYVISTAQTCLGWNAPVTLADGTMEKIGKIVNGRKEVEVKSYNEVTGTFENRKVVDWIKVPVKPEQWYRLTLRNAKGWSNDTVNTKNGIWITNDHQVLTQRGWVRVDALNSQSDKIYTDHMKCNSHQQEFIDGMMLGDGHIQMGKNSYRFVFWQTGSRESYIKHICETLKINCSILHRSQKATDKKTTKLAVGYQSKAGPYWKEQRERWYSTRGNKIIPDDLILTPLSLATWYMDDGSLVDQENRTRSVCLSTEGFSYESFWKLFYKVVDLGFKPTAVKRGSGYQIRLGERNGDIDRFFDIISPYVLPVFRYKLSNNSKGYSEALWNLGLPDPYLSAFEVVNNPAPKNIGSSSKYAYCLVVEGTHNFISNHSVVHNCFASNSIIINRGANILWADINPLTGNIDPNSVTEIIKEWEHDKRWNGDIKAIMAVNWGGRLCDYKKLKSHGIPVIEDAAHTWGIPHRGIERGDYVCYSFQAIKFLTTGDGGALIPPKDKEQDARLLRWYGLDRTKGESFRCTQNIKRAGFKYHMNDIAASIGLANLNDALDSVNLHTRNAYRLAIGLRDSDSIIIPPIDHLSPYWLFTIILDDYIDKDHFVDYMTNNGIATSPVHYRNDLYDATEPFQRDDLPGLDSFSSYQLNIPNGWWLSEDDINHIIKTIKNYK